MRRQLWLGEHDADLLKLSDSLTDALDQNKQAMQNRAKEFPPLARLLSAQELAGANFMVAPPVQQSEPKKVEGENKPQVSDGDVTEQVGSKEMASTEKKHLVDKLNREAIASREAEIEGTIQRMAAEVARTRVKVFKTVEEACRYMQGQQNGLVARTILADITMLGSLQFGGKTRSRNACRTASSLAQGNLIYFFPAKLYIFDLKCLVA